MRQLFILYTLFVITVSAQEQAPQPVDLIALSEKLQAAIDSADWKQAVALSSALKSATEAARDQSFAKGNQGLVSQLMKWLPLDTETLMVSSKTVSLPMSQARGEVAQPSMVAASYLLGLIASIRDGELLKQLRGQTLSLSVVAAKHFQNHEAGPRGELPLGLIAYQGCGLYAFTNALRLATFSALDASTVAGRVTWSALGKEDDSSEEKPRFLTLLKPNLLMVCNDRQFYETAVSRFTSPAQGRALPDILPEWEHVDRSAPFWALRHYIPTRASEDPTMSTIGGFQAGSIGLTFQIGSPKDTVRIEFLGKAGGDPFKELDGDEQFAGFKKKLISPGVWQLSATSSEMADPMFVFLAMGMLGFAILL